MTFKSSIAAAAAVAALSLWVGQAQASVYNLNLTGSVGSAAPFNFTDAFGNNFQGQEIYSLNGMPSISLNQGDQLNVTVTLDAPWTVPPTSKAFTSVNLLLFSTSFENNNPQVPTTSTGTVTLSYLGNPFLSQSTGGNTANQVGLGSSSSPPNGGFVFDKAAFDFTVSNLGTSPQTIDTADIYWELGTYAAAGVPEPATWAMLILGMAMMGWAVRRRSEAMPATAY